MNKDQVLNEARRQYRQMREKNKLLDELFRRFDLELDIEGTAVIFNEKEALNRREEVSKSQVVKTR